MDIRRIPCTRNQRGFGVGTIARFPDIHSSLSETADLDFCLSVGDSMGKVGAQKTLAAMGINMYVDLLVAK